MDKMTAEIRVHPEIFVEVEIWVGKRCIGVMEIDNELSYTDRVKIGADIVKKINQD